LFIIDDFNNDFIVAMPADITPVAKIILLTVVTVKTAPPLRLINANHDS